MIISLSSNSFVFDGTICAPADLYSSSVMPDPRPAPFSTNTLCPSRSSALTPPGTRPTRCSRFLISFGQPILIAGSPGLDSEIVGEAVDRVDHRHAGHV